MRAAATLIALLLSGSLAGADGGGPGPLDVGAARTWAWPTRIGEVSYTPGRGVALGSTGLHLGGYATLAVTRDEGDPGTLTLDDLSFFVLWQLAPRLKLFSELEVEDVFEIDDEGHVGSPNRFSVERLYADVGISDALTVRAGTFLTPVGRWNLVHAAPLVWTTSRPLTTEVPFDPRSTGVMAYGSFFPDVGDLSYSLYAQLTGPIEGNPGFTPARNALGGRLVWWSPGGTLSLGASVQTAERRAGWRHLGGLDLLWHHGRFEVEGEGIVQEGANRPATWGLYLQAAVELTPRLFYVERFEHFAQANAPEVNLIASGLLFRVLPNAVLKAEYLAADTSAPHADPGFKASAAILF